MRKCSKLENDVVSNESSVNALEQYGRKNNIVVSGISGYVSERNLEETVISVLSDIEVNISANDVEACHRIGKPDRNKSKKTIVHFLNRKHCKKALLNRRKLENLDKEKHGFSQNIKVFINEHLTLMNENIAFSGRKLKQSGLVHACFTINGIVRIKKSENSKPLKVFHMKNLCELFPDLILTLMRTFSLMYLKMQELLLVIKVYFLIIFTAHLKKWEKMAFGGASALNDFVRKTQLCTIF